MHASTYTLSTTKEKPIGLLIFVHIFLGFISVYIPGIVPTYVFIFIGFSILKIIQTRNQDNYAAYVVVYLASLELLCRLSHIFIVYELGKYSVILILLVALMVDREKKPLAVIAILYFVLLLPSIIVPKYADIFQARS